LVEVTLELACCGEANRVRVIVVRDLRAPGIAAEPDRVAVHRMERVGTLVEGADRTELELVHLVGLHRLRADAAERDRLRRPLRARDAADIRMCEPALVARDALVPVDRFGG